MFVLLRQQAQAADTAGEVHLVQSRAMRHLFTRIRDEQCSPADFVLYSSRLMRILAEEGIALLPAEPKCESQPSGARGRDDGERELGWPVDSERKAR